jgi:hypothetical protein
MKVKKEKQQITIRIDSQLLAAVREVMKEEGLSIGDITEQGLRLELHVSRYVLPAWAKEIRMMVCNATAKEQRLLRCLLVAIAQYELGEMTEEERKIFELIMWYLNSRNEKAHASECLQVYARRAECHRGKAE